MPYVYVDSNIHLYTYDMSEYISKSNIIKYTDSGWAEKSIQIFWNKSTEDADRLFQAQQDVVH